MLKNTVKIFALILVVSGLLLSSTMIHGQNYTRDKILPKVNNVAKKYFLDKGPMKLLATWGSYGAEESKLYHPVDMTIGQDGTVFICGGYFGDPFEMSRVQCFTREGKYLRWFGGHKFGNNEPHWLSSPNGIAVAPDGTVWVTLSMPKKISHLTAFGEFLFKFSTYVDDGSGFYHYPGGPSIDKDGYVYLVDTGNDRLMKFDSAGNLLWQWGKAEKKKGKVGCLRTCSVAPDGTIFVGDDKKHTVFQLDSSGNLLNSWGRQGSQAGRFEDIEKISIGPDGTVYVLDKTLNRIQRFGPDGTFITKWGSTGTGKLQFRQAYDIAVSLEGLVYVLDYQYNANTAKIKVFAPKYYKSKETKVKLVGFVKNAPVKEKTKLVVRIECENDSGDRYNSSVRPAANGRFIFRRLPKGTSYTLKVLGYDTSLYRTEPAEITGEAGQSGPNPNFKLVVK